MAWVVLIPGRWLHRPVAAILAGSGAAKYRLLAAAARPEGRQTPLQRPDERRMEKVAKRSSTISCEWLDRAQRGQTGRTARETGGEGKSQSDIQGLAHIIHDRHYQTWRDGVLTAKTLSWHLSKSQPRQCSTNLSWDHSSLNITATHFTYGVHLPRHCWSW